MKTFGRFLSLLICFEFILGPVQGSIIFESAFAEEKPCPAGQDFDGKVNRCLTKAEVLKVNNAVKNCANKDHDCYRNNAVAALGRADVKKKNALMSKKYDEENLFNEDGKYINGKQRNFVKGANAAAIAIPLVIITSVLLENKAKNSGKSFSCKPPSLLLMYAAAAALGAGEIFGWINHDKKLKKIKKQWDESVVPDAESSADKKRADATEAQSQAFEFFAQNEEQVGKTAKTKKGFYLAASGLFAAGMVAAIFEKIQISTAQASLAIPSQAFAAQQTISRLTCNSKDSELTGKNLENAEDYEAEKAEAGAKIEKAKAAASENSPNKKTPDAVQAELESAEKARITRLEDEVLKNSPNSAKAQEIKNQRAQEAEEALSKQIIQDGANQLKRENKNNQPDLKGIDDKKGSISHEKMKKVAAYNLSTAKDAEQLLQLMKELEAIEFENYSRISYLEAEEAKELKKLPFPATMGKIISEALIPSSHAQSGGGFLATAGVLLPMLGMLKGLIGSIKLDGGTPLPAGELNILANKSKSFVVKAISNPTTRIAINGVLGGWMGIQTLHMQRQQNLSEKRAKKLRELKEEFATATGIMTCTETDRVDSTKPRCFCFTSDNKINPSRANQSVCKMALAGLNSNDGDPSNDKVCVTQSMSIDPACSCRNTKGPDGKNTCMKASFSQNYGFNPSTFKMIGASAAPANDLFNGTVAGGDIADSAGINAARVRASADAMLAKMDPKAAKDVKSMSAAMENGLIASAAGMSMGNSSNSSPLPTSPQAAAAALDKEIKEKTLDSEKSTSSFAPVSNFGGNEPLPEFGLGAQEAAAQEIEIAEVMGKEVDFGSNDINKAPETNLFEVLSNRYKRSGMKRLFEDGTPADAPSKTDISN